MAKIFYDTECFGDLFHVSFMNEEHEFTHFTFHREVNPEVKRRFKAYWAIQGEGNTFVSFNGLSYDNAVIEKFLGARDITIPEIVAFSKTHLEEQNAREYPKYTLTPHYIDVRNLLRSNASSYPALKKTACELGAPNIMESSISFDVESLSEQEVEQTIKYCDNDVKLTEFIFESDSVQGNYMARCGTMERFGLSQYDAMTRTPASVSAKSLTSLCQSYAGEGGLQPGVEKLVYSIKDVLSPRLEFQTNTCRDILATVQSWERDHTNGTPPSPVCDLNVGGLEARFGVGGLHSKTKPFVFKTDGKNFLLDIDVDSYYPNVLVNLGIGPKGFEKEYCAAITEVLRLKRESKTPGERYAAKLLINASTGYLKKDFKRNEASAEQNLFYSPMTNESMTVNGQLIMLELIESMYLAEVQVTQINTDGITVLVQEGKEDIIHELASAWAKKWDFKIKETEITHMIQTSISEYFIKKRGGEIKTGGGFFNPYEDDSGVEFFPILSKCVVDNILFGTPIEDTVRTGSPLSYARHKDVDGKKIEKEGFRLKDQNGQLTFPISFNKKGVNRFYISKSAKNKLFTITRSAGQKEQSCEDNVRIVNDIDLLEMDDVDFDVYVAMAKEKLFKFKLGELEGPLPELYRIYAEEFSDKDAEKIEGISNARRLLMNEDLIKKRGHTLVHCPDADCNPRNGSSRAELYETDIQGHVFCHQCRRLFKIQDLESLFDVKMSDLLTLKAEEPKIELPKEPEIVAEESQTEIPVFDIKKWENIDFRIAANLPERVWTGSIGELSVACDGDRSWAVLNAGLTLKHAIIGHKIKQRYVKGTITGNLFSMQVAQSSRGKGASDELVNIVNDGFADPHVLNVTEYPASGQAVFETVSEAEEVEETNVDLGRGDKSKKEKSKKRTIYHPLKTLVWCQEMALLMRAIEIPGSSLEPSLCKAYQNTHVFQDAPSKRSTATSGAPRRSVERCELSLGGTLTTDDFERFFTKDERMASGFMNRILFFPLEEGKFDGLYDYYYEPKRIQPIFQKLESNKTVQDFPLVGRLIMKDGEVTKGPSPFSERTTSLLHSLQEEYFKIHSWGCGDPDIDENIGAKGRLMRHFMTILAGMVYENGYTTDADGVIDIDPEDILAALAIVRAHEQQLDSLLEEAKKSLPVTAATIERTAPKTKVMEYLERRRAKGEEWASRNLIAGSVCSSKNKKAMKPAQLEKLLDLLVKEHEIEVMSKDVAGGTSRKYRIKA